MGEGTQYGNMLEAFAHKKIAAPCGGRYLGLCPRGEGMGLRPTPSLSQGSRIKSIMPTFSRQDSMPEHFTQDEIQTLPALFGTPRFARYLTATESRSEHGASHTARALALYRWNGQVAAAMLFPLNMLEVVLRNAIADALASTYGPSWPLSRQLLISLPNPQHRYSQRKDLEAITARYPNNTGQVIAELAFVFWVEMLNTRHDGRIWEHHLRPQFPHAPARLTVQDARRRLHAMAEEGRRLRNRIAHHEPIFPRNLAADYETIHTLIAWRSPVAAAWLDRTQTVTALLPQKPEAAP